MGHGVLAALITAMIARFETHAVETSEPGRLLTQLNSEFTGILKQTGTLVFVTVLDFVINIKADGAFRARGSPTAVECAEVPTKCRRS